jgi:predicted transcriptional regulator
VGASRKTKVGHLIQTVQQANNSARNNSLMPPDHNQPEFTRRKFTNTESLDEVLTDIAEQHYQGNISLCLRAAIEDHRTTVNGTKDTIVVEQLSRQIASLQTKQEEAASLLKTLEEQVESNEADENHPLQSKTASMSDAAQKVYYELYEEDSALRIEDIAERTGQTTSEIQPALGHLIDRGYVVIKPGKSQRFRLASHRQNNYE